MTETSSSTVLYQKWIGLFLFHKWYNIAPNDGVKAKVSCRDCAYY